MADWKLLRQCLRDERGAEVLEYVILVALLVLACVAALGALGIRVQDKWPRLLKLLR